MVIDYLYLFDGYVCTCPDLYCAQPRDFWVDDLPDCCSCVYLMSVDDLIS